MDWHFSSVTAFMQYGGKSLRLQASNKSEDLPLPRPTTAHACMSLSRGEDTHEKRQYN